MKKLFTVFAVAAVMAAGAFAQDVTGGVDAVTGAAATVGEVANVSETLQGVWFDQKYNCNWQFQVNSGTDAFCVLKDASSGAVIYTFTRAKVKNFKGEMEANKFVLSWECPAKNRIYKFVKEFAGNSDLLLDIYNDYYKERHSTRITFVNADARVE